MLFTIIVKMQVKVNVKHAIYQADSAIDFPSKNIIYYSSEMQYVRMSNSVPLSLKVVMILLIIGKPQWFLTIHATGRSGTAKAWL